MLKWYSGLYVGEQARRRINRIQKKIEHGRHMPDVWLISLASNGRDQLDIFDARDLLQPAFRARCPMIVGVAYDRYEAIQLVVRMAEEAYAERQDGNIRAWLEQMEEKAQHI